LIKYYHFAHSPLSFSKFKKLSRRQREKTYQDLRKKDSLLVEVICFCLMPNHFHFLLKQVADQGISKFLADFQNSYARYFNAKNKRIGSVFQGPFRAVLIESEEQLIHLSRYIHLNPYSSAIVRSPSSLLNYSWSSFQEYLGWENGFCQKEAILSSFSSLEKYRKFVFNQADYQKQLEKIKHLIQEDRYFS